MEIVIKYALRFFILVLVIHSLQLSFSLSKNVLKNFDTARVQKNIMENIFSNSKVGSFSWVNNAYNDVSFELNSKRNVKYNVAIDRLLTRTTVEKFPYFYLFQNTYISSKNTNSNLIETLSGLNNKHINFIKDNYGTSKPLSMVVFDNIKFKSANQKIIAKNITLFPRNNIIELNNFSYQSNNVIFFFKKLKFNKAKILNYNDMSFFSSCDEKKINIAKELSKTLPYLINEELNLFKKTKSTPYSIFDSSEKKCFYEMYASDF